VSCLNRICVSGFGHLSGAMVYWGCARDFDRGDLDVVWEGVLNVGPSFVCAFFSLGGLCVCCVG